MWTNDLGKYDDSDGGHVSINASLKVLSICTVITAMEIFQLMYPVYQILFVVATFVVSVVVVIYAFSHSSNTYSDMEQNLMVMQERNDIIMAHIQKSMFKRIFMGDVSNNMPYGDVVQKLIGVTGVPGKRLDYDKFITLMADTVVHPEFKDEYKRQYDRKNIHKLFLEGITFLDFEHPENTAPANRKAQYRWLRTHTCIYRSKINRAINIISFVMDIDDEKKALQTAQHKSKHDLLTQLYNKISTEEEINHKLKNMMTGVSYGFVMLDMDNFKRINDNLGHSMGDTVLSTVSGYMRQMFRDSDILGRIGGDEFVMFIPNIDTTILREKLENLNQHVKTMPVLESREYHTSLSIGVIMGISKENDDTEFSVLYNKADELLYHAKKNGKGRVVFGSDLEEERAKAEAQGNVEPER